MIVGCQILQCTKCTANDNRVTNYRAIEYAVMDGTVALIVYRAIECPTSDDPPLFAVPLNVPPMI